MDVSTPEQWMEIVERFADRWDQKAFDAEFPAQTLEHFEPMVVNVFARAKSV